MISIDNCTLATQEEDLKLGFESLTRLLGRDDVGFFDLPQRETVWKSAMDRCAEVKARYKKLFVIGIGGSSLGAKMLIESCHGDGSVEFFENVDASSFWGRMRSFEETGINWSDIHWLIVSKSGGTMETLAQAQFASQFLKKKHNIHLSDHATVITENKENTLKIWASENQVKILEMPLDVGGRFSVLSPVGLFPAAFAGLNLVELRDGAIWGRMQDRLVAELVAQSLRSFRNEKWITLFWSYSDSLKEFGLWVQQLWAESLAKKTNRAGNKAERVSTPIPLTGAVDQHSVLQQVCDGASDKFIWFIRSGASENTGPVLDDVIFPTQSYLRGKTLGELLKVEAQATRQAVQENGAESLTLLLDGLDERVMGALIMIMELTVGAIGEALDINAFDQPGVELGKTLAKSKLIN